MLKSAVVAGQQILEDVIKYRWGALPEEQREGIKNYISNLIIKLSTDEAVFRREKTFVNKLNIILVQVPSCSEPAVWLHMAGLWYSCAICPPSLTLNVSLYVAL